jgi:hypothetical protein
MRPGQASRTLLITSIMRPPHAIWLPWTCMRARHQLFDSPLILAPHRADREGPGSIRHGRLPPLHVEIRSLFFVWAIGAR